jgi:hypothetical protein
VNDPASAEALYVAVGIPQGIIVDPSTDQDGGTVRRAGQVVSVSRSEYLLWTLLLSPLTHAAATETVSKWGILNGTDKEMALLAELGLVAQFPPGAPMDEAIGSLRPIPLGFALGNIEDESRFEIQNSALSLSTPVALDIVAIMMWWEFDGLMTLQEAASRVASLISSLSIEQAERMAMELVPGLMANRLMYLDALRPASQ